jgi:hypothetical protein
VLGHAAWLLVGAGVLRCRPIGQHGIGRHEWFVSVGLCVAEQRVPWHLCSIAPGDRPPTESDGSQRLEYSNATGAHASIGRGVGCASHPSLRATQRLWSFDRADMVPAVRRLGRPCGPVNAACRALPFLRACPLTLGNAVPSGFPPPAGVWRGNRRKPAETQEFFREEPGKEQRCFYLISY